MNQIQKQSVLTNEAVNRLSMEAENFLHRLLNVVDRYGCYDGRIAMLRAYLFPLKVDEATAELVAAWLTECVNAGLIRLYEVNDHPYLEVTGFKHSTAPRKTSIPAPPYDTPGGTTPMPERTTTTIPAGNTHALHEHFLKELYRQENAHHLNRLCLRIKQPTLKQTWVQAFNAHLNTLGKKHTINYEWQEDLRRWLTLNVQRLKKIETETVKIVFDPAVV